MLDMITKDIMQCTSDMHAIADTGKYSLEAQVRAFDLLEKVMDFMEGSMAGPAEERGGAVSAWLSALGPAEDFCSAYEQLKDVLEETYDGECLKAAAEDALKVFVETEAAAAAKVAFAEKVHECAKETFEIWQHGGYFARHRALRRLRALAGFRLESSRIGNYVAKTYDLMNEARMAHARSQQAVFAADSSYKVRPGVYADIYRYISKIKK